MVGIELSFKIDLKRLKTISTCHLKLYKLSICSAENLLSNDVTTKKYLCEIN